VLSAFDIPSAGKRQAPVHPEHFARPCVWGHRAPVRPALQCAQTPETPLRVLRRRAPSALRPRAPGGANCRCARGTGADRLPERRNAPTADAPQARVRPERLARQHNRGHREPVRPARLCFQTSRATARCAGAPEASGRPHCRSTPSAPRALTPRGVVCRCASSASAPQARLRREPPARRRVRTPSVPVRPCDVRPELQRASPRAPSRPPPVRC